jgi:hypothetical protein
MSDPVSERRLLDAGLTKNVTLPNAATVKNTAGIDLGQTTPFPITEAFHVKVSTSVATGANNKNITVKIQDSADNSTFANIAALGALTVTDANGAGFPAGSLTVSLPASTRRYIRGSATGEANGGNAADGTLTVDLLF